MQLVHVMVQQVMVQQVMPQVTMQQKMVLLQEGISQRLVLV